MGFPRGWQLPQGSRAGLRAVGNAVAAACRNGRRRGANTGAGWRRGRGCARAAVQGRSSPLTHAQVPPPLAHAVMAAAVRVHAPAPAAPVPAAPPAGDDDPDDLHALRRKLRRLTERVDALEAAAAPEPGHEGTHASHRCPDEESHPGREAVWRGRGGSSVLSLSITIVCTTTYFLICIFRNSVQFWGLTFFLRCRNGSMGGKVNHPPISEFLYTVPNLATPPSPSQPSALPSRLRRRRGARPLPPTRSPPSPPPPPPVPNCAHAPSPPPHAAPTPPRPRADNDARPKLPNHPDLLDILQHGFGKSTPK